MVVRLSYDAWGQRRGSNWSGAPTAADVAAINTTTHIGFTAQEQLDNLSLVHLNGRVYDPVIGRFLSADPLVQAPYYSQSFNRYSYGWNNPLNSIDPTGFAKEKCAVGGSLECPDVETTSEKDEVVVIARPETDASHRTAQIADPQSVMREMQQQQMLQNQRQTQEASDKWIARAHVGLNALSIGLDMSGIGAAVSWLPDLADAILYAAEGDWSGAGLSAAAAIPVVGNVANAAKVAKVTKSLGKSEEAARGAAAATRATTGTLKGLGNIGSHSVVDAGTALEAGQKWLGAGYKEIAPGVFRSADGLRQFRMTNADILGRHGNIGSHVHFEALNDAGKVIENLHLPVTP